MHYTHHALYSPCTILTMHYTHHALYSPFGSSNTAADCCHEFMRLRQLLLVLVLVLLVLVAVLLALLVLVVLLLSRGDASSGNRSCQLIQKEAFGASTIVLDCPNSEHGIPHRGCSVATAAGSTAAVAAADAIRLRSKRPRSSCLSENSTSKRRLRCSRMLPPPPPLL